MQEHGLIPNTEEIKINKKGDEWTLASVCPVNWAFGSIVRVAGEGGSRRNDTYHWDVSVWYENKGVALVLQHNEKSKKESAFLVGAS